MVGVIEPVNSMPVNSSPASRAPGELPAVLDSESGGLMLARFPGEEIVVGRGRNMVVFQISEVHGDRVSVKVRADRAIPVHRREVFDRIQRESARQEPTRMEQQQKGQGDHVEHSRQ